MLVSLHIKNYVIIDALDLDFQLGMTVISGETGAGKSIIMDALELAIGGRAETHVIKHGQNRCEITACFNIAQTPLAQLWLSDQELSSEECIFRRTLTSDGRSRSTINGQVFPVQKTRELAQYLLDIHGQHEHQSLLKTDTHRKQLDDYIAHLYPEYVTHLNDVAEHYKICQTLRAAMERLPSLISDEKKAREALLTYQWEELEQAGITVGEAEKLHQEHVRLSQTDLWLNNAQGLSEILNSDEEIALQRLFATALNFVPHSQDSSKVFPAWNNIRSLLEQAQIQCQEAQHEVNQLLESMEVDPERLAEIEERLKILHALARKHQTSMEDLPRLKQTLADEIAELKIIQEKKSQLEAELKIAETNYHSAAQIVSDTRKKQAKDLEKAITHWLHQLGLAHAQLEIVFNDLDLTNIPITNTKNINKLGYDRVEYYITTNPSQPSRPLAKVASGGELSRISLAIEVVTTQQNADLTRLFDEVDVGIGGHTAAVVGRLLRTLGEKSQVLCITHQPQTAAQGHQHLYVEKKIEKIKIDEQEKDIACFYVHDLDREARIREVARMLGGLEMTSHTLAHAEELMGESSYINNE